MKKILLYITILLLPVVFVNCDDDDNPIEEGNKVTSLKVLNTENALITLIEQDSLQINVGVLPEDAVDKEEYTYKFTSENDSVFSVSSTGVVRAYKPGEAALRIDAVNNTDLWTICIIKVEERLYPVTSIEVPSDVMNQYVPINSTFNLGENVTILPENASDKNLIYVSSDDMLATVDEKGVVTTLALGDVTITVKSTDGSGVEKTIPLRIRNTSLNNVDRTGWSVSISHEPVSDATVNGAPESLVDGVLKTCLLLVKPGKTFNGVTIPSSDFSYFVVDMTKEVEFNYVQLRHRTDNTSANLRVTKVDVLVSDDNITFTQLVSDAPIAVATTVSTIEVDLPSMMKKRYVKIVMKGWASSGNTMQVSEFNVGTLGFDDSIE